MDQATKKRIEELEKEGWRVVSPQKRGAILAKGNNRKVVGPKGLELNYTRSVE